MRLSSNGIVHKAALWSDKLLPSPCSQHGRFFLQGRQAGKQKYVRICSPPLGQQDSYHYVLHIKQVQSRILLARSSLALWDNYSWMKCLPSLSAVSFHLQQIVWWSSTFPASDTFPCYSWLWWNEDTLKPSGDNIPHFFRDVLGSRSMEKASSCREIALALSQKN